MKCLICKGEGFFDKGDGGLYYCIGCDGIGTMPLRTNYARTDYICPVCEDVIAVSLPTDPLPPEVLEWLFQSTDPFTLGISELLTRARAGLEHSLLDHARTHI